MYQRCPDPDNCLSCQRFAAELSAYGPLTEESTRVREDGVRAFIAALERGRSETVKFTGWERIKVRRHDGPVFGPKTLHDHVIDESLLRRVLGERYRPNMTDSEVLAAIVCKDAT